MPKPVPDIPINRFLPATLIPDARLEDGTLERALHQIFDPDFLRCERTEQGKLRLFPSPPVSIRMMAEKISADLQTWITKSERHGRAVIRRRFFLNSSLMMCPDVAYVQADSKQEMDKLDEASPLQMCPRFVAEICAHPKEFRSLQDKMFLWIVCGVKLGWLFVPHEECVYEFLPQNEPEIVDGDVIVGDQSMKDFFLFLDSVWSLDVNRRSY
jgi:Uma2 family endonuclease